MQAKLLKDSFGGLRLRRAFAPFDASGKAGSVTLRQFRDGLLKLDLGLNDQEIHRLAPPLLPKPPHSAKGLEDKFFRDF